MAQYTCEGAAVPETLTSSCNGVVLYPAAARYSNLSQGYAWDEVAAREREVSTIIDFLATTQTVGNRECLTATKAYVCTKAFPYCPFPSGGVSYLPACSDLCEHVKRICDTDGAQQLDCKSMPARGEHCFSLPADGFFLLPGDKGSYKGLPATYVCFLLLWIVMCAGWWGKVCRGRNSTRLHLMLLAMPVIKVFILLIAAWFWLTCQAWGYCGFWLGVVLTNAQLVFETSYFFAFLCIANGWCIAFENISREKWRHILIRSCTFYMCESMLLVFKEYIGWLFWVMTGLLYGTFIFIAFELSHHNVRWVLRQLNQAEDERWNVMAALLVRKLKTLRLFQFTMLLYLLLEITTHIAASATENSLATALIAHEVIEATIALSLAYILLPDPTSGLYYTPLVAPGAQNGSSDIAPFYQAKLLFEKASSASPKDCEPEVSSRNASPPSFPPSRRRSSHSSAVSMASMTRRRSSFAGEFGGAGESKSSRPIRDVEGVPIDSGSLTSEQEGAAAYEVKRPWWLMAARKTSADGSSNDAARQRRLSRGFVVVIQNPSRNATAMAARCSLSRASIMIGGPPRPPTSRRNSNRGLSSRDIIKRSQTIPAPRPSDGEWSSDSSEDVDEEGEDIARRRLSTGSHNSSSGTTGVSELDESSTHRGNNRYFEMEMVELASRSRRSSTGEFDTMNGGGGDRGRRQIEAVAGPEDGRRDRTRNRRRASAPPPPPPPGAPPPNQPRIQDHSVVTNGLSRLRSGSIGSRRTSRGRRRSGRSESGLNEPLNQGT